MVTNRLTIYENKKIVEEVDLFYLPVPSSLVFLILPFRSFLNFWQILWQSQKLRKKYGKIDIYFTVNGFAAWIGLILRQLGIVDKTIYWVCDYYPMDHKSRIIKFMRLLYWQFEKRTVSSDKLAFHNQRLVDAWQKHRILLKKYKALLIPIATSETKVKKGKNPHKVKLCFLGVLKKSQGLDFIIDSAQELQATFPGITVEVMGPGIDEGYFKKKAAQSLLKCNFYGYVTDKEIDNIISHSTIGVAPYLPDPDEVSYYGDPGKVKRYLSLGLPVITTPIHEFTKELESSRAGILVEYGNSKQLVKAIKKINSNYQTFSKNAADLNKKYFYKDIYPKMFDV